MHTWYTFYLYTHIYIYICNYRYECIFIYTNVLYIQIYNLKLSINSRNISTKYVSSYERHQVNVALHSDTYD